MSPSSSTAVVTIGTSKFVYDYNKTTETKLYLRSTNSSDQLYFKEGIWTLNTSGQSYTNNLEEEYYKSYQSLSHVPPSNATWN